MTERDDIFPVARKNKEMAVTDIFYQITAICALAQIVVRQHKYNFQTLSYVNPVRRIA